MTDSLSPTIAKTLTFAYFLAVCFIGLSPSKGISIAARILVCLSVAHAIFIKNFDFASWIITKRNITVFFLLQLLGWLMLIPIEFYSFEFSNFDTGIFANNIMRWHTTGEYYSSILGMHALADHFTPNLLMLAPLLSLWDSFIWLPLIKVCAWAWSVYLLGSLSRDILGSHSPYRYLVPGIYLVNQFVANTLLMEFQPSSLAIPLAMLAFQFAYREKLWHMAAVLLVLLGFKEHLGVVWISIGLLLALERKRVWLGATLIALGTLEGLVVYKIVMPLFAGGMVHHDTRIAPLSGIIGKSLLIIKALASFGLLPLFCRWGVIYALPGFILVLMGGDLVMQSFDYHYHDLGFALLACSSILGLRSLAQLGDRDPVLVRRIFNVIVLLLLTHAIRFPTFYIRRQWPSPEMLAMHRDIPAIKRYIDEFKPIEVWTLDHLGPYFHEQLNLKSILKPELPASASPKVRRLIIISPHVKTYPLRQLEYRSLQRYLGTHYSEVTESAGVSSGLQVFISGT